MNFEPYPMNYGKVIRPILEECMRNLSPEYIEAVTRTFEVHCMFADKVNRAFEKEHPKPDFAMDDGETLAVWLEAQDREMISAFCEFLTMVGLNNPNCRFAPKNKPPTNVRQ